MTATINLVQAQKDLDRARRDTLIRLASWVASEDAKRRLGLPSEWNQSWWLSKGCGTACCVAGKLALDSGGVPAVWDGGHLVTDRDSAIQLWAEQAPGATSDWILPPDSDQPVDVGDYARDALGLDRDQADRLFNADNDLDAILTVIAEILGVSLTD